MNENLPLEENNNPSTNLTQSVRSIWTSINSLNEVMSDLLAENKEYKMRAGEIDKLWNHYNELKTGLPVLEEKAAITDNLIAENSRLKIENNMLSTQLDELKEVEKNFALSQQEFISKNKILAENADKINKLKEQIAITENKILDLSKQIQESKNDDIVAIHEQEMADLNSKHEIEVNKIIADKKDIESRFEVLLETTSSQESMLGECSQKLFDLNKYKDEFDRIAIENLSLKNQYELKCLKFEEQASEVKRLSVLVTIQDEKIKNLLNELSNYETQYWETEDEKFGLKAKIQEMIKFKEDNIDKIHGFDSSIEKITSLNKMLETKTKEIENLKNNLEVNNNNINNLKNALKIRDNELILLSDLKNERESVKNENLSLKEEISGLKANIENLINDKNLSESKISENLSITDSLRAEKNEAILKLQSELENNKKETISSISAEEKEHLLKKLDNYINKIEGFIEN
jgi:chromosome segregation ATPase